MSWKDLLRDVAANLEEQADSRRLTSYEWNGANPIQLIAYRSFSTSARLHVRGRVLIDPGLRSGKEESDAMRHFLDTFKRLTSAEVPEALVLASRGEVRVEARTDEDGYFEAAIPVAAGEAISGWQTIGLELVRPLAGRGITGTALTLIPPASAEFGVISDIDDTVVKTEAASMTKMLQTVLTRNARRRLPFEGVAGFYRALVVGRSGAADNPIFYVSSGPWNLYDMLIDFFEIQGLPEGPLLLQDYGIDPTKFIHASNDDHKIGEIRRLLETYPDLPFILIGDSGQRDPEIYETMCTQFPGRITAIYIRDVSLEERDAAVVEIGRRVTSRGVPMIMAGDTRAAQEHAVSLGLVGTSRS